MHDFSNHARRNGFLQHFENMSLRGGLRHHIAAKTGGEHHRQSGRTSYIRLAKSTPVIPGIVRSVKSKSNPAGRARKSLSASFGVGMGGHQVSTSRQHLAEHVADGWFVIHQQDALAGAGGHGLCCLRRSRLALLLNRQKNLKFRALVQLALDRDGTLVRLDQAMHHSQSEAGALANGLGGEEWFEDARFRASMPWPVSATDSRA